MGQLLEQRAKSGACTNFSESRQKSSPKGLTFEMPQKSPHSQGVKTCNYLRTSITMPGSNLDSLSNLRAEAYTGASFFSISCHSRWSSSLIVT